MARCVDCSLGRLRVGDNSKEDVMLRNMTRLGFVNCGHSDWKAVFIGYLRDVDCDSFTAAPPAVAQARRAYFEGQR